MTEPKAEPESTLSRVNHALTEAVDLLEEAGTEAFADEDRYFEAMKHIAQAGQIVAGEESGFFEAKESGIFEAPE